jgi:hypothetical protein
MTVKSKASSYLAVCLALFPIGVGRAHAAPVQEGETPFMGMRMRGEPQTAAPSTTIAYSGGAVLSHVGIIAVFWGSKVDSKTTSGIDGFYNAVVANNYVDWLDEYYSSQATQGPIERGFYLGSYSITPGNTNTTLSNEDIAAELATQVSNGHLPHPGRNSLFMVHFPSGISINNVPGCGNSCVNWAGCHSFSTQTINGSSVTFPFAMIPDGGCGGDFSQVTEVASHELAESITDPFGSGWGPEIGDPCSWQATTITDYNGNTYTVQKLYSNSQGACVTTIPECQRLSDTYGITAGVTFGFAPSEVQSYWIANNCNTTPNTSADLCQKISEIYGTSAHVTWGFAPPSVQAFWGAQGCNTRPLNLIAGNRECERIADGYETMAYDTWGAAPSYARDYWGENGCVAFARERDTCQQFADYYGTFAGVTFGFAPNELHNWWSSNGCNTSATTTVADECQNAANEFAIVPGVTFGGAPAEVQSWWVQNGCSASAQCQALSDRFGIIAWQSFGWAPSYVRSLWGTLSCTTVPLFVGDQCQLAADNYGIVGGQTFGAAPSYVQSWWTANGCNTHPRSDNLREFTNGNNGN